MEHSIGSSCSAPSNYFNYFNHSAFNITGTISDNNGSPIANAVIHGWSSGFSNLVKTFSDQSGNFELFSSNPINIVFASSVGSSVYQNFNVGTLPLSISLDRQTFTPNLNLSNITVSSNSTNSYRALDNIVASNFRVMGNGVSGGSCNMQTENFIRLEPGFAAEKGSHFHAFTSSFYLNCADPALNQAAALSFELPNNDQTTSTGLHIVPNPSYGIFKLLNDQLIDRIEVYDLLGRQIRGLNLIGTNEYSLNLMDQNSGSFFIKVFSNNRSSFHKVIISK